MPAKIYRVHLRDTERSHLQEVIGRLSEKSIQVKRSYILLAADEHGNKQWKDDQISEAYGVGKRTVERLRQRFVEEGLEVALQGKHREVVREQVFDGEVEAKLIALRCSAPPSGYARWTLHLLADKMIELQYVEHISHESVRQLLKKTRSNLGG